MPPVFMGGTWAHPLGSDELGRDVLSRLIMSIRLSLLIAFFGTMIAAAFGTAMGFVAAHFRGKVEALILMLIDFQASMPFLIIALAVLAFFGNNLALFVMLMGLNSWERYARIARGLTLSANEQGYAAAVRQLGASNLRVYGLHVLPNIASTLIVSMTITFPETILLEMGLSFLGLGVQPPLTLARQHGGLWPRVPDARAVDHAVAGRRDRAVDPVDSHRRRLAARPARPDAALMPLSGRAPVPMMNCVPSRRGRRSSTPSGAVRIASLRIELRDNCSSLARSRSARSPIGWGTRHSISSSEAGRRLSENTRLTTATSLNSRTCPVHRFSPAMSKGRLRTRSGSFACSESRTFRSSAETARRSTIGRFQVPSQTTHR